jgi:hypothetical protein
MKRAFGTPVTLAVLAASAMLSSGSSTSANLVANPNFDLDSPPAQTAPLDWTFTPAASGSDFMVGPGAGFGSFSPPNAANFGATGPFDDELSQVLSTVAGDSYTISFELAHPETNTANDFSAWFGGAELYSLVNASAFPYTLVTLSGVATSSSTTLAFYGRENPFWYVLDNVSVTGPAIPETPTWTMLLAGFAGLGLIGMRGAGRRQKPLFRN